MGTKSSKKPINIVISGITGRMGEALLVALASNSEKFNLTGGLGRKGNEEKDLGDKIGYRFGASCYINLEKVKNVDVILDFSEPNFSLNTLNLALDRNLPLLIGTTGHSEDQVKQIEKASSLIPVLLAPNTSIGIALIKKILTIAQDLLFIFSKQEIYEKHHLLKKDSPSGTAFDLLKLLKSLTNNDEDVTIESARKGDSLSEHSIILQRESKSLKEVTETIKITHEANDRSVFAEGALLAAEWLINQREGLYTMSDFYLP